MLSILASAVSLLSPPCLPAQSTGELTLVPAPRALERPEGAELSLPEQTVVAIASEDLRAHGEAFADLWWRLSGTRPSVRLGDAGDFVLAVRAAGTTDAIGMPREDYRLVVEDRASVVGDSLAAVTRGTATLLQLARRRDGGWALPEIRIEDEPAAPFRAVLVDVARQPHSARTLRHVIELLYLYKVRFLHLHLTDNQAFTFPFEPVTNAVSQNRTLSLEAWRELAQYADALGVTIVPSSISPDTRRSSSGRATSDDPTPADPLTDADVAAL